MRAQGSVRPPASPEGPSERDLARSQDITLDDALVRMASTIAEERAALRKRDAATVARLATEKEILLAVLTRERAAFSDAQRTQLQSLAGDLRHNAILLAHARDSLRDALSALERAGVASAGTRRLRVVG